MVNTQKVANDEVRAAGAMQYVNAIATGNAIWAAVLVKMHGFNEEEQHSMNREAFKLRLEEGIQSAVRDAERITGKIDITAEEKIMAAAEVMSSLGDYAKISLTVATLDEKTAAEARKSKDVWDRLIRPQMEKEL